MLIAEWSPSKLVQQALGEHVQGISRHKEDFTSLHFQERNRKAKQRRGAIKLLQDL